MEFVAIDKVFPLESNSNVTSLDNGEQGSNNRFAQYFPKHCLL